MVEDSTFRTRLLDLIKKSRKAIRLYGSVTNSPARSSASSDLSETQAEQWKEINSDLMQQLSLALEEPTNKRLTVDVCSIRDHFYAEWQRAASELAAKQARLVIAAQSSDFVRAAMLSEELVGFKARVQAAQAAFHELTEVMRRSRIPLPAIELSQSQVLPAAAVEDESKTMAKVIPLRRREA